MRADPKDVQGRNIPEGDYPFIVVEAIEKISKAGNDLINLKMQFEIGGEKPLTVFDCIVDTPTAAWKGSQFAAATGMLTADGGAIEFVAQHCIGRTGKAHLLKDTASGYMAVRYYLTPEGFSEQPAGSTRPTAVPAPATIPAPAGAPESVAHSSGQVPAGEEIPFD